MSVDNPDTLKTPEQIIDDIYTAVTPYSKEVKRQALAALDAYYKAQASKDMVEVIGKELRVEQRKTAASKGYKLDKERLNG